jgi:Fanconi anemia group M protein
MKILYLDFREVSLLDEFKNLGYKVVVTELPIGDIVYNGICFERKTIDDLLASIFDGRWKRQLYDMRKNYDKSYVVVSGDWILVPNKYQNNVMGAITLAIVKFSVPVIFTGNEKNLVYCIHKIIEKSEYSTINPILEVKKSHEDVVLSILSQIPGFSESRALIVLNNYKTIEDLVNASVDDLKKLGGIGEKLSQNLYRALHEPTKLNAVCPKVSRCKYFSSNLNLSNSVYCSNWNGKECKANIGRPTLKINSVK